jgi:hypothetical protein
MAEASGRVKPAVYFMPTAQIVSSAPAIVSRTQACATEGLSQEFIVHRIDKWRALCGAHRPHSIVGP